MKETTKRSIRVEVEDLQRLEQIADEEFAGNLSVVIRHALKAYIKQRDRRLDRWSSH